MKEGRKEERRREWDERGERKGRGALSEWVVEGDESGARERDVSCMLTNAH